MTKNRIKKNLKRILLLIAGLIFVLILVSPTLVTGATDSRHYAKISDDVYRFCPLTITSEDIPRYHGINERIRKEYFKDCIRFYAQIIKNSNEL